MAPPGTLLTITASPARIPLTGQSVITVTGRRPDGNPLSDGTEIRFSTTLGTIDAVVEADSRGVATAVLRADGRQGSAMVRATTGAGGDGAAEATLDVLIGEDDTSRPMLLVSANPTEIPVQDTSTVTVIARNADGTSVGQGQTIILTTTLGSLNPSRPVTDRTGTATSILDAGDQAGTATIGAILGSSMQATTTVTIRDAAAAISLQATPPTVSLNGGTIRLDALVTNAQGEGFPGARVTFLVNRGTLSQTGVVPTNDDGIATNMLTLTMDDLRDLSIGSTFQVTARTVTGAGEPITSVANIRVQ